MSLNLTIDQGNSAVKLALWDPEGNLVEAATALRFGARDVAPYFEGRDIDTAIYCTVSTRPPTLMRALERKARRAIEFNVGTPTPLKVDYRSPSTLGLDRLAAAVGAYSLAGGDGHELLVVDLGTAITYDRVTADRRYVGGNIAPGINMRLKALNHYTARLPLVDPRGAEAPVWGDDTRSALLAGAVRGVVAELEYYYRHAGDNVRVVLTGGCAAAVAPLLSFDAVIEPNLVSTGLRKVIEFNTSENE